MVDQHLEPRRVAHREGHQEPVVGAQLGLERVRDRSHPGSTMADERALREPRRPARVDEIRGRGFVDRPVRHVGSPGRFERLVSEPGSRSGRVTADDHDPFEGFDLLQHRFDHREEVVLHDQHPRAGVGQDPRPLPRVQPVVQQGQDQSGAGDAVLALDVFRDVAGQDRHPVAGFRDLAETPGELRRCSSQFGERDGAFLEHHCGLFRPVGGAVVDDLMDRHRGPPGRRRARRVRPRARRPRRTW